jgi:hypothetical protein
MHPTKQTYAAPKLSVLTDQSIQESDKMQVSESLKAQAQRHMPKGHRSSLTTDEFFIARARAEYLNSKTARDFASVDSICQRMMK